MSRLKTAVIIKWAETLGSCVQGIVLGVLLFAALCGLVITASGVTLFRYQLF